ncbi:MAG: hypothetical protein HN833_00245 [Elusimicrobiaceae bacterium]|jgi:hypothetical protein|nr:hypothetical protein [Elusimicrobiaceae bacterium]MBT3954707.1 hypothetical protein [Elusimicrobiaceae bacterium]MBT4007734.1 hypothetical protein [Elusimicrobiaceae bacterium]MBT4402798.1 hypothetical protein [Elusimicrobiaceae bacterium]MBT4439411.1 hypothetical protein [Elusimicrobiaceae bacterium]
MRKLLLTILFLGAVFSNAYAVYYKADYTASSSTNQARAGIYTGNPDILIFGAEYGYYYIQSENTAPKKAHSGYLPFFFNTSYGVLKVIPFYYHEPKIKKDGFGATLGFESFIKENSDGYVKGFLDVSGTTSKDITVNLKDGSSENKDFNQLAYTLGVKTNYYDSFYVDVDINIFQYLSGVSKVSTHNLFIDQKDLAPLKTVAPIVNLPEYSAGLQFAKMFEDNKNKLILSYGLLKFHDAKTTHSFIIGNSLKIQRDVYFDIYYNYLTKSLYNTRNYLKFSLKRTF